MAVREQLVRQAAGFLTNDVARLRSPEERQEFLASKGLDAGEVAEAERRAAQAGAAAGRRPPPASAVAVAAYDGAGGAGAYGSPAPGAPWPGGGQAAWPQPLVATWLPQQPRRAAPWWALLLGGLGFGSLLALLSTWLLRRRRAQAALVHAGAGGAERCAPWYAAPAPLPLPAPQAPQEGAAAQDAGEAQRRAAEETAAARLEELSGHVRAHVEETRRSTELLRRTLERQQRQYQTCVHEFERKLEDALRRKGNVASQRVEISPESLHALQAMLGPKHAVNGASGAFGGALALGASTASDGEAIREWFGQVERSLCRMLRAASSKAEAKKSLQTVSMIMHNLVTNPSQEKYREVNTGTPRFRETFGSTDGGAAELLLLAGFESRGQLFVVPAEVGLDKAERVRDFMQDALRDCDGRWERATAEEGSHAEAAAATNCALRGSGGEAAVSGALGSAAGAATPPAASMVAGGGAAASSAAAAAGGAAAEAPKSQPWLSSVVQKQLARRPQAAPSAAAAGGAGAASSSSAGPSEDQEPLAETPRGGVRRAELEPEAAGGAVTAPAHPAEAHPGVQEPQSGG